MVVSFLSAVEYEMNDQGLSNPILSAYEQIPGSGDRTGRGVISYLWHRLSQKQMAYLKARTSIVNRRSVCRASLQRHVTHCERHPKDKLAAMRMHGLEGDMFSFVILDLICEANLAVHENDYRQEMLKLADVPRHFWLRAEVEFIQDRDDGSVTILFGGPDPADRDRRAGCWHLYANGAVHRERTPAGIA